MGESQKQDFLNTFNPTSAPKWSILLVEDEEVFARAVVKSLERAGHVCTNAKTLYEARQCMFNEDIHYDLVILDMRLPDGEGLELIPEFSSLGDTAPSIIVATAYGDISQAVEAIKLGAVDYLKKPLDLDELLVTLDKVMRSARLKSQLDYSHTRESHGEAALQLLGHTLPIQDARNKIQTISEVGGESPPTVLIQGETGTGKDVAAHLLHSLGVRANRPFVHIDCTSLPKDMLEAELFGHVRGAFTSAHTSRAGLIEAAEDGTVFLDEIGEIPIALQAKLLHVLERRQLRRVGSTREIPIRARFVAATNRNISRMVDAGEFRDDLYFRLNVLTISMPTLRHCRDDIPVLVDEFLNIAARSYGIERPSLSKEAIGALMAYDWPGNVRELRNVIDRALLLAEQGSISINSLQLSKSYPLTSQARKTTSQATLPEIEKAAIEEMLRSTAGNTSEAARRLGITRMKLRYRLEKYGIQASDHIQ